MESALHLVQQEKRRMRIASYLGLSGKPILEYIPENEADRERIYEMMLDGEIPDSASQSVPADRTPEQIEHGAFAETEASNV